MTTKMKGLLKGLRYISQIFDSDDDAKEPEMMIGYPTDVKHVAHIGWDGPAVKNSPSWMNDFKPSSPRQPSSSGAGDDQKDGSSFGGVREESSRGIVGIPSYKSSPATESSELPKSSRRHNHSLSSGDAESPTRAKSGKHRPPRRSSKAEVPDASKPTTTRQSMDSAANTVPSQLSDPPKKSRRKKPKDSSASARSSSRSLKPQGKDPCSPSAHENESLSTRRNVRDGSQGAIAVEEEDGIGHGLVS
ncbi:hypothetical protein NL676_030052 [Syzygium grande]|nr:hypothetical protein NL676_030052 [Syzygium grande]